MVTTVAGVPIFALGYRYSEHKPGTTEDADFWFLIQASAIQMLSISMSCIPLYNTSQLPKRVWIPLTIIALLCTLLAIPLYAYLPTEWSNFLSMVGASIQAFMVLQIALVGE
jgi:hypothetical protein